MIPTAFLIYVAGVPLLEAALLYAANDWPIFPLIGKLPPRGFDGGHRNATTDAGLIRKWWSRWPDANVGWAIPADHFVLDEDPRHGGDFARTMLERAHGPLPFTLRQLTGGGGYQWAFRSPVPIHQRSAWWDGIDTRAAGRGYVVVAPSIHPDTRARYQWHTVAEPAIAPAWLIDAVKVPPESRRAPFVPTPHPRIMDRRRRYALAALAGEAREVAASGKGTRNDRLNRAWWRLAQFRDVLSRAEVEAELTAAAIAAGLPVREIAKVLR